MEFLQVRSANSPFPSNIQRGASANMAFSKRQRLARFLDRPLFPWKKLIIGFSLTNFLIEGFLGFRQYQVLKRTKVPKVLEHEVTQEVFDKSQVRCLPQLRANR